MSQTKSLSRLKKNWGCSYLDQKNVDDTFFASSRLRNREKEETFFCDTGNLNSSLQEDNLFEKKDVFATFSLFFFFTYLFHSALEGTKQNSLSPSFFSIIKDVRERRKIQLNHLKRKVFISQPLDTVCQKYRGSPTLALLCAF